MAEPSPHVEALITLFAAKDKRERLLFLASKPPRWGDLRDALLHDTRNLDLATLTPVAKGADVAAVLRRLRGTAKSVSYCISGIFELDAREVALGDALKAAMGRQRDTIVWCVESQVAFYENHEGEQFVLERKRTK